MSEGDVYMVRPVGTVGGFPMTNVFWYQQTNPGSDADAAEALANLFDETVLSKIVALQHESCLWSAIEVVNYRIPESDYAFFTPENDTGLLTGSTSPNYTAFGYRLNRLAPGQRAGYKRFAGAIDDNVNGNVWSPDATAKANLAAALCYALTAGLFTWEPVIVKHSDKDEPAYGIELGTNPDVQYRFLTATPLTVIRTQVSRRRANVN